MARIISFAVRVDRRETQRDIFEHLDIDPAKPEHHDRTEHRIALDADHGLDAALVHGRDQRAFDFPLRRIRATASSSLS